VLRETDFLENFLKWRGPEVIRSADHQSLVIMFVQLPQQLGTKTVKTVKK